MLRFHLLGGLQISLDDEPVTGFVSSKVQALLCYIAINRGQTHLRSSLAVLFWGDMPDEDAATNLRQAIANLKRLLEPYVEITRQSILFKTEMPYWLDVEAFETTRDPKWYRGELLAGFGVADAPDFDEWLTTERERLHGLAISALRQEAAVRMSEGQDEVAAASLNRLLRLDPLDEEAHRQSMLLLAISGQRSAALAQYEKCRDVLRRELAVEPEAETTRLYERLRAAQKLTHLPSETTPFVGRGDELTELDRRLRDANCHLITIVGLGGMGKTRLALRAAHRNAQRRLHGAVLVNLASVRTLDSFLSALADGLRFKLMMQGAPRTQLLDFLREKHLLLVLDNVEQLAGTINDFLLDLLQSASDLKMVMTSRQRFNLRGEWVLALHGLPFDLAQTKPPAQALFWETARRVRGDDLLTDQSAEAVGTICKLVYGMPLAIELAAAWSRLLTCEELAEEIASNLTGLEAETEANDDERHGSLRAVFDYSWRLFSTQEQGVLMALSAFVTSFTREAAQEVAGASLAMLLGLADKMLLQRQAEGRFLLHEMLRQYLVEKLAHSSAAELVQAAYLRYFTAYLERRRARLKTGEQQALLDEMTWDIDNIHAAWEGAVRAGDRAALAGLMPALSLFHNLKSNWRIAESLFRSAEATLDPNDVEIYGAWLSQMAFAFSRLDQPEQTTAHAERCLALLDAENPAHQASIARALLALGYSNGLRGAHGEALAYLERALVLRQRLGDQWDCAQCLLRIGSTHGQRAQIEVNYGEARAAERDVHLAKARAAVEQALEISTRLGDQFLTARLRTSLAALAQMRGDVDESIGLHQMNLVYYEAVDSPDGRSMTLNGLGNVAYMRQDYGQAQAYYHEAIDLARQVGARAWEANALTNLAIVASETNDLRMSRGFYLQAQAIFHALGNETYVTMIENDLATIDERLKAE